MMGLDDPYPLGEMEGIGTSLPGRVVDYAVKPYPPLNRKERTSGIRMCLDWLGIEWKKIIDLLHLINHNDHTPN